MAADRRFTPTPKDPSDASGNEAHGSDEVPFGEGSDERTRDRGVSDFFRRAVSAGYEAATKSKDDILRVATGEIRSWLDHLELDKELVKALSRMTVEVKAEIRFKPNDEGKLIPEAKTEAKVRGPREDQGADRKNED